MHRILIIEDESRIAAFIDKGLRQNGFSTAIATDGEQALLMAQTDDFDLMLLDLGLPLKNGWEVLEELRRQERDIPVIIVTARDDIKNRQIKVSDYVTKPFKFQDLLTRIQNHFNNSTQV